MPFKPNDFGEGKTLFVCFICSPRVPFAVDQAKCDCRRNDVLRSIALFALDSIYIKPTKTGSILRIYNNVATIFGDVFNVNEINAQKLFIVLGATERD